MARIPTYQKDLYISDLDRIIGTDGDTNELTTKNFFLGDIAEYVIDKFIDPDAVSFTIPVLRDTGDNLGANATRITGSIMSQDTNPDGTKISVAGLLQADKEVKVRGKLVGGVAQSGQLVLNSSLNATGITIKAPSHENLAVSYSMELPNDIGVSGAQLTTDGVGALYWAEPEDDNLTFAGDSGQGLIDLDTEVFSIVGGDNVVTTALGQTLTINLEDVVTGSGTTGFLPLWDASGTGLIDSSVSQFGGIVYVDNNLSVAGALNMQLNAINNVLDPVNAQDAATKAYVDAGNANQVDGSGTLNYVPLWTPDGNTIGDSIMVQTLIAPNTYGLDVGSTRITELSVATSTLSATTVFATDLNGLNGGTVTLNGDTILGNAATDTITVNGEISLLGAIKDSTSTLGAENQILVSDASGIAEWNDISTLSAIVEGVQSDITYYEVKNSSGAQIVKGKGVMAVGTDGNSGHILIDEMVADGSIDARYFLGILNETLNNGDIGRVIAFGEVDQINTNGQNGETWTGGEVLWCDPNFPGDFTLIEPLGPNLKIPAAFVLKASTSGKVQVRVQANEGLHQLHDTKIETGRVSTNTLTLPGTGYAVANDVPTTGGAGTGFTINVLTIGVGGDILTYSIASRGNGYVPGDVVTVNAGNTDATITINAILAEDGNTLAWNDTEKVWVNTPVLTTRYDGNRVGINTATPVTNLHVQGGVRITGGVDLFQQHDNAFAGSGAGNQGTIIGSRNTAFGKNAMAVATVASNNAAVGMEALTAIVGGNNNVAVGSAAGSSILNGSFNIALGAYSLSSATNTQNNIAIGYQAQQSNISSNNNIAIGGGALGANTASNSATVIGPNGAAGSATSVTRAVVIGSEALGIGSSGADAVLVGNQAGQNNNSAWTVAIGSRALQSNTNGAFNTAIGGQALSSVTNGIGRQNVGVGYQAGNNITTGQNDIVIGFQAQASSATASNEITLGNSSISVLRCAVTTITSLSDERDKTDITDLEYGLDFINSLSPKQFTWDQRPEYAIEIDDDGNETQVEVENANKGKKDFGFIAQDVKAIDNEILRLVYDENPEKLEMSYGKLVPILVKAIKELTARVEALEA